MTAVRYLVVTISLVNGLWMLIDGIHVMMRGRYIGPDKPGPWASVVGATGVDVFKLGPVFAAFGLAWLVFAAGYWSDAPWARLTGIVLSAATLWYLPFGTLISVIVLIALIFFTG